MNRTLRFAQGRLLQQLVNRIVTVQVPARLNAVRTGVTQRTISRSIKADLKNKK
jgi:hypothetical protein